MTHEAAVPLRPGLRHVVLADPSAPLPLPRRKPIHVGPSPETLARLRDALSEEADGVERLAREERTALEKVVGGLQEVARDLRAQQKARLTEMQQVAVELACAVASGVLYERIAAGDYAIEELIRRAVRRLEPREALTVYLHPEDLSLLERRLGDNWPLLIDGDEVRCAVDANLGRGDCRAESGDVSVLSNLEEHLAAVRRDLLHILPEAEVERRQSDERTLRRFPDRRHTA